MSDELEGGLSGLCNELSDIGRDYYVNTSVKLRLSLASMMHYLFARICSRMHNV